MGNPLLKLIASKRTSRGPGFGLTFQVQIRVTNQPDNTFDVMGVNRGADRVYLSIP